MSVSDDFIARLNARKPDEAIALLKVNSSLADTSKHDGLRCFSAAIASNDYHVVRHMLAAGARMNVPMPGNMDLPLFMAVSQGRNESLRAMLTYHPDLVVMSSGGQRLMEVAWEKFRKGSRFDPVTTDILSQLVHAGAMAARGGYDNETEIENAMRGRDKAYIKYLMTQGADLVPVMQNRHMRSREVFIGAAEQLVNSGNLLDRELRCSPPPAALLNSLAPDGPLRASFLSLLGANQLEQLSAPAYWEKHGGMEEQIRFIGQLHGTLPPYLDPLRERLSVVTEARDAPVAHPDSVLVRYMRAGKPIPAPDRGS